MNLTSLATSAFDTARSTFKAMAEAAVPPAEDGANAPSGSAAASSGGTAQRDTGAAVAERSAAPRAVAETTGSTDAEAPKAPVKGRRLGTVLDSYA